ncbi:MAG: diphosphate--fructose-6-phosphate 1-phosphotransferase [Bacteroidales bacterium]|jgi:6-phosphofructokinase 1|nr:diphosphate--fructose-6-phosphate 1-phosphotransferase [Bacteroidales bacterium]MDD2812767.1 diphosphate--fructose-6-phosphate 1-phosphotransferase [Bacteroidales bacterium]MDD3384304.1 diphosphate--fructose-6-phosphate 1-phosphotransferase [Bacteroidales bacterium]MDD3810795.1 diphosphate--fructose-6-phosphate 1-phosphotransferase [Bacteroidales bacterium]MDD4812375.1 diphosphate--fructose-6-phosphate 1-phosphotransferase [Bacteroidales bacterium]
MIKGNCIIGQSGGPTSVINSSLAGVIDAAIQSEMIESIYGMNYGIEGFMKEWLIDLGSQPKAVLSGLRKTPGSALGSSRHKLKEEDFPRILEVLKKYDIHYFFLIGGNDTMDTINRVEAYCRKQGYELTGVGVPKTVDNDLFGTDHTPGFPSAARSNILNVMQAGMLARDMKKVDQFVVYQTIGRDAGWLGAATALARRQEDDAPHLIYCPEFTFSREKFLADVDGAYRKYGWVSVVCGEGLKYEDGTPVSASQTRDKFNNTEFGAMGGASVGLNLHRMIREEFGFRGEFQITESLIMSDFVNAVDLDLQEAYLAGKEAVRLAEQGVSGYMVTIERVSNAPYEIRFGRALLNEVAVHAKPMPSDYFNAEGNFVSDVFLDYIRPLIGPLPEFVRLTP